MKSNITFLFFIFLFILAKAQDVIVPKDIIELNRKRTTAFNYGPKVYRNPDLIPEAIKAFEDVFEMNIPEEKYCGLYSNYADLIVRTGDFEKAIHYYDLAFQYKKMTAEEFGYSYRKGYFAKDTLLYNNKKKEYYDYEKSNPASYTNQKLALINEIKEIFAADQFARKYAMDYPKQSDCAKNIIEYVDAITMERMLALFEKYPEYNLPLGVDRQADLVISRHIFTAYPQFWLTHFEPRYRKAVMEGSYDPQNYAIMYDRCMIKAIGAKSYYGEWDNNGMDANPDKASVNKRRANLGLVPVDEKEKEDFTVRPVYTN